MCVRNRRQISKLAAEWDASEFDSAAWQRVGVTAPVFNLSDRIELIFYPAQKAIMSRKRDNSDNTENTFEMKRGELANIPAQ